MLNLTVPSGRLALSTSAAQIDGYERGLNARCPGQIRALPGARTCPPLAFAAKVHPVCDHLLGAYDDDGPSVDAALELLTAGMAPVTAGPLDLYCISGTVVERTRIDPRLAAREAAEPDAPGRHS